MNLILLALAPGIAICLYIFHRDAYNREPKRNLLLAFILGAVMIVPAALIENALGGYTGRSIRGMALMAFVVVALTEELSKFVILRWYALRRPSFDEPLDGIVYSVVISMGFATLENILYVQQYGMATAWLRMFLAVPAHASFGVMMGYYAGMARFSSNDPTGPGANAYLVRGVLLATLFHGLYDFFLFLQGNVFVNSFLSDGLLFTGALASFIIGLRMSLRLIREHRLLSQKTFHPTETMSVRRAYPADVNLIRDLAHRIWPDAYRDILSADQLDYMLTKFYDPSALHKQMETDGHEFVILYDGVEATGFASFSQQVAGVYELHKLYVLPSQQGRGSGRFLVHKIEEAMHRNRGTHLRLNVNRHNRARGFYEKIGFQVIGEEDIDIGNGHFMNDYVMEKTI